MSEKNNQSTLTPQSVGALTQVARTLRLVWRLLSDARVSVLPKLILLAAAIYVISPIDLIPDVIPVFGQLDDIGIVILAINLFVEFCPRDIVEEHRRAIDAAAGLGAPPDEDIIDGSFREVK